MANIEIKDLSKAITDELEYYSDEVFEATKKAVDEVSEEVNREIKNHCNFKEITGKYKKSFRIKTTFENARTKRNTWYVANGEHRLTHLLEEGHAKKNGGRTRAFPHVKYGAEYAQNNLPRKIQEAIDDIK